MSETKSLKSRGSDLSETSQQLKILSSGLFADGELPLFKDKLSNQGAFPLKPTTLEIFQMNVGYMCNQVCNHCHVDAGPDRKEIMTRETMHHCIEVLKNNDVKTLDLTGGAPEMNPDFRWFVESVSSLVEEIIVRSNLTIIEANKKYYDLPSFFAKNKVRVVSSLPFYNADKTDRQRGEGVFKKSIAALQRLNAVGYGMPGSGLFLDLVYNPSGAFLPAAQEVLEADFKKALKEEFDIHFDHLFCITNLPISRFLDYLIASENYEDYMDKLVEAYNPMAVEGVMCRNTISVGWDGYIYDCDFNQMLDLKAAVGGNAHISEFNKKVFAERDILVHQHCYGCTAGAGSSCQGTLV